VANNLAFYNTAKIAAVKSFIVQAPGGQVKLSTAIVALLHCQAVS